MDQKKSKVVKSKSSNSALPNDKPSKDKKTCSSVEVQPNVVKKRGVYVEKKTDKPVRLSPGPSKQSETPKRSPNNSPPPRRDRKKFLTSVLTILSQNTTSTQFPENRRAVSKDAVTKRSVHTTKRRRSSPIPMAQTQRELRKPKYRSKTLNNNPNEVDKFIVWKKDTNVIDADRSPSSESTNGKLAIRCDDELSKNSVTNQNSEPKPSTRMQQRMELEPDTLVSQDKDKEDKSGIYDFFVDLLETTLSVYNVKTELNPKIGVASKPSIESSVKLEIDESVATKLNELLNIKASEMINEIEKKKDKTALGTHSDNAHNFKKPPASVVNAYIVSEESNHKKLFHRNSPVRSESISSRKEKNTRNRGRSYQSPVSTESIPIEVDLADEFIPHCVSRSSNKCMRRRVISPIDFQMFDLLSTRSRPSMSSAGKKSQSFAYEKRKNSQSKTQEKTKVSKKRYKKQTLLGMLKEELSADTYVPEEPQNLFEALKIMAKNKRRSTKIQFADDVQVDDYKVDDFTTSECMKRKKLISPLKKKKRDKTTNEYTCTYRSSGFLSRPSKTDVYLGDAESYHSLVVFDPDSEHEMLDYDALLTQKQSYTPPTDELPLNSQISLNYVNEDDDQEGTIRKLAATVASAIDNRKANNENTRSEEIWDDLKTHLQQIDDINNEHAIGINYSYESIATGKSRSDLREVKKN